jgi:hypothetical protein
VRSQEQDQASYRTVSGYFNGSTGAVISGTGFSVTRTGVGAYTVRFHRPFRAPPHIVATPVGGQNFVATNAIAVDSFGLDNRVYSGGSNDANQMFTARGLA